MVNGILVLYGMKKADRKADREHPFGYGKELYFWTLVVSILIFAIGGGMSVSHGYEALVESAAGNHPFRDLTLNYVILILAMAIEGSSLAIATKQFNAARREKNMGPMEYIRESKDPSLFTVVLEDTAAEAGLAIAFIGMVLWQLTGISYFDGISSVIIGIILISVAAILMKESKGLLVGEGISAREIRRIESIVEEDPAVVECGSVLTNYFGPNSLLIVIDATFAEECDICEAMEATARIEAAIKDEFPQTARIFIEAESLACVMVQQKVRDEMLSKEEH